MKLKYEAKKGTRINHTFMGIDMVEALGLWWFPNEYKWREPAKNEEHSFQSFCDCRSKKAFTRRLQEWSKHLPSGTEFRLCSRWVGYDIIGKTK